MNVKNLLNASKKLAEACAQVLEYIQPSLLEGVTENQPAKRKPGRPPKVKTEAEAPKKPGRPPKAKTEAPTEKRKPGRPPKATMPMPKPAKPGPKAPAKAPPKAKGKGKAESPSVDALMDILASGAKPREELLTAFGDDNRRTMGVVIGHAVRNGKAVVSDDGTVSLPA